jgi:ADP-L-glycero-D-manno-heptose 6-epimerase
VPGSGCPVPLRLECRHLWRQRVFKEERQYEGPLDVHGYSKFLFDQIVRQRLAQNPSSQIVGLRYFNVYGPGERTRDRMASVAFQCFRQFRPMARSAFEGSKGRSSDFVFVGDVAKVNLYFLDHPGKVRHLQSGLRPRAASMTWQMLRSMA